MTTDDLHENRMYVRIAMWICLAIVLVVCSIVGSCSYTDYLVADMVAHGADPMRAYCGMHGGYGSCQTLAGQQPPQRKE